MIPKWNLIESDPAIFTEIIERLGVAGIKVAELFSLEQHELQLDSQPVFGFIFLFKWDASIASLGATLFDGKEQVYYAKQVVKDACATQAILSILMNIAHPIGNELTQFKAATKDLPPSLKGEAIGQNDLIRKVHNSFFPEILSLIAPSEARRAIANDEEAYHFIAYVQHSGNSVLELDGLAEGPLFHQAASANDTWIGTALNCIKNRISK